MINLKKDYKDYLALLSILAFSLLAFIYFSYDRQLQVGVMILTGGIYVLWGVVHHLANRDFHWRVLVEYLIVALFGVILVLVLLGRT